MLGGVDPNQMAQMMQSFGQMGGAGGMPATQNQTASSGGNAGGGANAMGQSLSNMGSTGSQGGFSAPQLGQVVAIQN